jgi:hypothetical protein
MLAHLSIISLADPKGTPRHPHGSGLRPCLMMARRVRRSDMSGVGVKADSKSMASFGRC